MKVLLVGNSSIDESKKYGEVIDDFDLVVRMNRYQIDGFENYIGSKTNIWVLNRALSLGKSAIKDYSVPKTFEYNKKFSKDLEYILLVTYIENSQEYPKLLDWTKHNSNLRVADTFKISNYLRSRWDKLIEKSFYKPATGLLLIHYFLEEYDKIYLHNFDCGNTKHYWDDSENDSAQPMSSKHNWSFDEILISELVNDDKVKYLRDL